MHLSPTHTTEQIAGEYFIFQKDETNIDLTRVISLSESSAWLWEQLEGKEFTYESAAALLTTHYDVDQETALQDVQEWCTLLKQHNLLSE